MNKEGILKHTKSHEGDLLERLKDPELAQAYLEAAVESYEGDGNAKALLLVIKDVAEANHQHMINYGSKLDVLYIVTREGKEEEFVEIAPGINIELDEKGRVIGIEILNASEFLKSVAQPLYEHIQAV